MNYLVQLFSYPFRVFFLSAAAWALLSMVLWLGQLNGTLELPLAYPALLWHRSEMLFGLLNPAIAGFLLTAVCVWTNSERLHGRALALLWLVWLAGRVGALLLGEAHAAYAVVVNALFLPLVMVDAGRRIVAVKQWRQVPLLVVIGLLWLCQWAALAWPAGRWFELSLLLVAVLMLVVGGRITPAFTGNWLRQHRPAEAMVSSPWLERLLLPLAALLLLAVAADRGALTAPLATALAALTAWRLYLWRGWLAAAEPLLWMLHLSLAWIPVALLLLAGQQWLELPSLAWQHALGIGAMAGLIVAVMTRVALGHTGRPLLLPRFMVAGYWLVQVAVASRLAGVLGLMGWTPAVALAGVSWVAVFFLYLVRYGRLLGQPRADGREG
jgi:uncharacterized protein involved in response to NO